MAAIVVFVLAKIGVIDKPSAGFGWLIFGSFVASVVGAGAILRWTLWLRLKALHKLMLDGVWVRCRLTAIFDETSSKGSSKLSVNSALGLVGLSQRPIRAAANDLVSHLTLRRGCIGRLEQNGNEKVRVLTPSAGYDLEAGEVWVLWYPGARFALSQSALGHH